MTHNYRLADAEDRARQWSTTFKIPDQQRRQDLRVGDHAKLIFEEEIHPQPGDQGPRGRVERMWVEIHQRTPNGRYIGKLLNQPALLTSVKSGDDVEFGPEHVADWDTGSRGSQ